MQILASKLVRGRLVLVSLLVLFGCSSLLYSQYEFKVWTADDGLPQNIIRGIYQTPDGFLWIATLNGLARFDGVRFTVFNSANTPGLISSRLGMQGTPNGDLWINTKSGDATFPAVSRTATQAVVWLGVRFEIT